MMEIDNKVRIVKFINVGILWSMLIYSSIRIYRYVIKIYLKLMPPP